MGLLKSISAALRQGKAGTERADTKQAVVEDSIPEERNGGDFGDDSGGGFLGDRRDFFSIHSSSPATFWYGYDDKARAFSRETVDLDVPAQCGFDFNGVRLQTDALIEAETGEVLSDSRIVLMSGYNLVKTYMDWTDMLPGVNALAKETWEQWDARFVEETFRDLCGREPTESADDGKFVTANLKVEDLTPTGRLRKYPLSTCVYTSWHTIGGKTFVSNDFDYDWDQEDCMHLLDIRAHYLPDGSIGKGSIGYGTSGTGIVTATFKVRDGDVLVSKIDVYGERVV